MAERAQRPSDRAVFVISVAAELAGVHPQTLRIYERKGLVHPKRTSSNSRRYSEREIDLLAVRVAELEAELARQARRHRQRLDEVQRSARRDLVLPWSSAAIVRYEPHADEMP